MEMGHRAAPYHPTTPPPTGTQTETLAAGGIGTAATGATEEYNGTSWSGGGTMSTARYRLASGGTQTATTAFGGVNVTTTYNSTEEYDGSAWAGGGNLGNGRMGLAGCGTQT
ncbi:MAG: hypothetical protein ACO3YQ_06555, partial [Flavobacteriales bacterium]